MSAELQPMIPAPKLHRRQRDRGFSLVELGIVIAVIAVLSGVVIAGAGFFRAARQSTAVDLVLTIRGASRQFAMRHQNGLRYGTSIVQLGVPNNVSLAQLRAEDFLPRTVTTPWDPTAVITAGPIALPALPCAGFACVVITMQVPLEECVPDANGPPLLVTRLMLAGAISAVCANNTLTVIMR